MTLESPRAEDMRMDIGALLGAVLSRWLRIILVTLLLLAATYAVLLFVPKMYEFVGEHPGRAARQRLHPTRHGHSATGDRHQRSMSAISSQIELIKSRDTLLEVIDAEEPPLGAEFNGSGGQPARRALPSDRAEARGRQSVDETVLSNLLRSADRHPRARLRPSSPIFVRAARSGAGGEHRQRHCQRARRAPLRPLALRHRRGVGLARGRDRQAARAGGGGRDSKVADFRVEHDLFEGTNNTSLLDQQLSSIGNQITDCQERQIAAQNAGRPDPRTDRRRPADRWRSPTCADSRDHPAAVTIEGDAPGRTGAEFGNAAAQPSDDPGARCADRRAPASRSTTRPRASPTALEAAGEDRGSTCRVAASETVAAEGQRRYCDDRDGARSRNCSAKPRPSATCSRAICCAIATPYRAPIPVRPSRTCG